MWISQNNHEPVRNSIAIRPPSLNHSNAFSAATGRSLQNSQQLGRAPLKGTGNPYSHNSAKNATVIRPVTFSCGENFNNIDLMMTQGHDFVPAVSILRNWLEQYGRDRGCAEPPA
jgi:hypothetical protein